MKGAFDAYLCHCQGEMISTQSAKAPNVRQTSPNNVTCDGRIGNQAAPVASKPRHVTSSTSVLGTIVLVHRLGIPAYRNGVSAR